MLACSLLALLAALPASDRVLVIENTRSPTSVEIATDYMAKRHVHNLLKVSCQDSALSSSDESIPYILFKSSIEDPLRAYLSTRKNIDFIVLTKGIPIRVTQAFIGLRNTQPSVDSYIAALDYSDRKDTLKYSINDSGFTGSCWANRFWNSTERFSHAKFGGYLVTRLDALSLEEAKLLTVYSLQAEAAPPAGRFLVDAESDHGLAAEAKIPVSIVKDGKIDMVALDQMTYGEWDTDLGAAGHLLMKKGLDVTLDLKPEFVGRTGELMGYCSWGSNDPKFDAAGYKLLRFLPGGIAETAVSTSARTFLPTSGGQSLITDLIHGRVTGVKGYCDEPLLQAIASPTVLLDRYTSGWTLAESFYAASRFVGWEDIVVGDPLCAPYAKHPK